MIHKQGFTLIELLVVVLIIGILASIALPSYQRAVMRARFVEIETNLQTLYRAQEMYYLANMEYADDISLLDVNIPENCKCLPGLCTECHYEVNSSFVKMAGTGYITYFKIPLVEAHQCAGREHKGVLYADNNGNRMPVKIREALGFTVDSNTCGVGFSWSRP